VAQVLRLEEVVEPDEYQRSDRKDNQGCIGEREALEGRPEDGNRSECSGETDEEGKRPNQNPTCGHALTVSQVRCGVIVSGSGKRVKPRRAEAPDPRPARICNLGWLVAGVALAYHMGSGRVGHAYDG